MILDIVISSLTLIQNTCTVELSLSSSNQIQIIGFVSDLAKPLSKEVMMQTVLTDENSGKYNKDMDLIDSMNMKVISNKCNLSEFASSCAKATREKSNTCSLCDYASSRAGDLRKHMKKHTGEKSNKCSQCDYASSRAGHLRTHMKTHTGEKSNSHAGNLKTHI